MQDLFNEQIICNKCKKEMKKTFTIKNGFKIRTLKCDKCGKHIYHPSDIEEYKKFTILKQRPFAVKLRIVGNSYAVSIPKEIISFIREQETIHNQMVKMCLEEAGKLSLFFSDKEE